jgi:uncharacterized protein
MKSDSAKILVILVAIVIAAGFLYQTEVHLFSSTVSSAQSSLLQGKSEASLYAPAVDNQGNGVVTVLKVDAQSGSGRTLVDVNHIVFWADTQQSIQTAKDVAGQISGVDLSKIDLVYSIQTNASLIEGPSAGAALTIATIAALENKTLNSSVMITGTINPDGTIGEIGGVVAKASAAKSAGATLFLVPQGQGTETNYAPIQKCEASASFTICTTTYQQQTVQVSQQSGIRIQEVSDIRDALKYFGL